MDDQLGPALAQELRALQALHTAKKPVVPTREAAEMLADFRPSLAEVEPSERRQIVSARSAQIERLAQALLVWRYTPLALTLKNDDPALGNDVAAEVALAIVEYGSDKAQEAFLREVVVNAGHPSVMAAFGPILVHGVPEALIERVVADVMRAGNELHLFNLLQLLLELRRSAPLLIPPALARELLAAGAKSKKKIVQRAAAEMT